MLTNEIHVITFLFYKLPEGIRSVCRLGGIVEFLNQLFHHEWLKEGEKVRLERQQSCFVWLRHREECTSLVVGHVNFVILQAKG